MNAGILLKASPEEGGEFSSTPWRDGGRRRQVGIALWFFIGVAGTLFSLFIATYVMRMEGSDWSSLPVPAPLWLSTGLLIVGSVLLQRASFAARGLDWNRARRLLTAGGLLALCFVGTQLWAWSVLASMRISINSNPAGSFFYLLTSLHGLHVLGGLVAWAVTLRATQPGRAAWVPGLPGAPADPARAAGMIALTARYWHFLLAVWVVLFAVLGWLTPEVVRFICGTG